MQSYPFSTLLGRRRHMDAHGARDIDDGAAHGMQGEEAATVRLVERDAWIRRPLEEPSKATVPSGELARGPTTSLSEVPKGTHRMN